MRAFSENFPARASRGALACAGPHEGEPAIPDPRVSILMVARNAEAHIGAALRSARRQTFRHIEILVVDDGSTDATAAIVRRHADEDARVRLVPGPQRGLAAVRNASLAHARGRYGAILDADDILHPRHIETLFSLATRYRADIAACNMLCFSDTAGGRGSRRAQPFLRGEEWAGECPISPARFVEAGSIGGSDPSLGYLKPLFDLRFLRGRGIGYDTALRIGEDYDLVDRALRAGANYIVGPASTYFYRRHAGSTSHRLACADLDALLAAEGAKGAAPCNPALMAASQRRRRSLERALAHLETVEAIKRGEWRKAARAILSRPVLARMLLASAGEGLSRRVRDAAGRLAVPRAPGNGRRALVIGRPRAGSAPDCAVRFMRRDGFRVDHAPASDRPGLREDLAGRGPFDAILLAEEAAWDIAPFALSPMAPLIGDDTLDPDLLDITLGPGGEVRGGAGLAETIADFHRRAASSGV